LNEPLNDGWGELCVISKKRADVLEYFDSPIKVNRLIFKHVQDQFCQFIDLMGVSLGVVLNQVLKDLHVQLLGGAVLESLNLFSDVGNHARMGEDGIVE